MWLKYARRFCLRRLEFTSSEAGLVARGVKTMSRVPGILRMRTLTALVVSMALVGLSCGDGRRPIYAVHGKVLLDEKPTPGALVIFHPLNDPDPQAPRAIARVESDGSFSPTTYTTKDGAAAGEYAVTVTWVPEVDLQDVPKEEQRELKNKVPDRYGKAETSGFKVEVKKGVNQLEPFRLTKKP